MIKSLSGAVIIKLSGEIINNIRKIKIWNINKQETPEKTDYTSALACIMQYINVTNAQLEFP